MKRPEKFGHGVEEKETGCFILSQKESGRVANAQSSIGTKKEEKKRNGLRGRDSSLERGPPGWNEGGASILLEGRGTYVLTDPVERLEEDDARTKESRVFGRSAS